MAKNKKPAKPVEPEVAKPKVVENQESVKDWTPPPGDPKYRVVKGKSVMGVGGLFNGDDPKTRTVNADNVGGEDCLEQLIEKKIVEKY